MNFSENNAAVQKDNLRGGNERGGRYEVSVHNMLRPLRNRYFTAFAGLEFFLRIAQGGFKMPNSRIDKSCRVNGF